MATEPATCTLVQKINGVAKNLIVEPRLPPPIESACLLPRNADIGGAMDFNYLLIQRLLRRLLSIADVFPRTPFAVEGAVGGFIWPSTYPITTNEQLAIEESRGAEIRDKYYKGMLPPPAKPNIHFLRHESGRTSVAVVVRLPDAPGSGAQYVAHLMDHTHWLPPLEQEMVIHTLQKVYEHTSAIAIDQVWATNLGATTAVDIASPASIALSGMVALALAADFVVNYESRRRAGTPVSRMVGQCLDAHYEALSAPELIDWINTEATAAPSNGAVRLPRQLVPPPAARVTVARPAAAASRPARPAPATRGAAVAPKPK